MANINNMDTRIKINYRFIDITPALQQDIKSLVEKNLSGKVDRYLKSILDKKQDAEIIIDIDIRKNKQGKYEGSFRFDIDGILVVYHNNMPFKNITDLINHAFDHLKQSLSSKK